MTETTTYSNVKLGDSISDRTLIKTVPFMVDGIAASQISDGVWAFRVTANKRTVTITELGKTP